MAMTPVELWNALKRKNEKILWTPMWNWKGFDDLFYREQVVNALKEPVSNLAKYGLDKRGLFTPDERDAICILFLFHCAILGDKDNDFYLTSLGLGLPPAPEGKWDNGTVQSVEDPYEEVRRLPTELVKKAERLLQRYEIGHSETRGGQLKYRILWESPLVLDDYKKRYILEIWRNIGYAESEIDTIFDEQSKRWDHCGDAYSFFMLSMNLLKSAQLSFERHGKILPEDVSPQIRDMVDGLNRENAVFKRVQACRYLNTDGEWSLFTECKNSSDLKIFAKEGYGEKFEVRPDDCNQIKFGLKLYIGADASSSKKILGSLPKDIWFFEKTEKENVYRMVPRKTGYQSYTYPLIVAVHPFDSVKSNINSSAEFRKENINLAHKSWFYFENEQAFSESFINDIPVLPVILRPRQEFLAKYKAANGSKWESIDYVGRCWPAVPQAQGFASLLWNMNGQFEVADLNYGNTDFVVRAMKLNTDSSQGTRIAVLPAGFRYKEICANGDITGVEFSTDELSRLSLDKPIKIENNTALAEFKTHDGGSLQLMFFVKYNEPNDAVATRALDQLVEQTQATLQKEMKKINQNDFENAQIESIKSDVKNAYRMANLTPKMIDAIIDCFLKERDSSSHFHVVKGDDGLETFEIVVPYERNTVNASCYKSSNAPLRERHFKLSFETLISVLNKCPSLVQNFSATEQNQRMAIFANPDCAMYIGNLCDSIVQTLFDEKWDKMQRIGYNVQVPYLDPSGKKIMREYSLLPFSVGSRVHSIGDGDGVVVDITNEAIFVKFSSRGEDPVTFEKETEIVNHRLERCKVEKKTEPTIRRFY